MAGAVDAFSGGQANRPAPLVDQPVSGQAVQIMNLWLGFEEGAGLC